jgi:predicted ATPase/DNA-binding CsgD family transcriptional regulator
MNCGEHGSMSAGRGAQPLTRREREVAALIAEGLTDREIAGRLYISLRTAEGHVQHIRNKLLCDNRVQIASWVMGQRVGASDGTPPPVVATALPFHNLPTHLTTFVGRQRELGEIRRRLQRARLLTISGPGGCGKTRLAVELASELLHRFPDGVAFVDLSSADDSSQVAAKVAAALGISHGDGDERLEAIGVAPGVLGSRQLLVLDNCEHLVETCAGVVATLLAAGPHLTVLCTSREPLRVAGEAVWKLGPLGLPEPGRELSLEVVRQSEAVRLFADRAGLSDPEFELTEANAAEVARLCQRLDGIPLALELAAARAGVMSYRQVVSMVEDHLSAPYLRSPPARHQTLSATIGWSYDLLSEPGQRLLERLSVFSGGFTVEAALAVNGTTFSSDRQPAFEVLTELVDKSLVLPTPPRRERYRCLGVIQRFAWQKLLWSGELDSVRARHLDFFLALAEQAAVRIRSSEQPAWLARLDEEHDNLRAANRTGRDHDVERQMRLVLALEHYWCIRGHLREGREWADHAVSAAGDLGATALHATLLNTAAGLAYQQGDQQAATAYLERSLAMWRQLGERRGIQPCLTNLGVLALYRSDNASAAHRLREGLALARELDDDRAIALALDNLGILAAFEGDHDAAADQLGEALAIMRRLGDPARVANSLANLGMLALYREQVDQAVGRYAEALSILDSVGAPLTLAECLEGLALAAARRGREERAVRLAEAATGIRESVGRQRPPWSRRLMEAWIAEPERNSSPDGGRSSDLGPDEVVALALRECSGSGGES